MRRRTAMTVVLALAVLIAACGTRVDETATPQTIIVERVGGAGGPASDVDDGQPDGTGVDPSEAAAGATGGNGGGAPPSGPAPGNGVTEVPADEPAAGSPNDGEGTAARGPATGEPIVLGAVGTRSGLVGSALEGSWRGLTVWQEWVNANGGVQGRPVRVVVFDDGTDPGRHAAGVRRLIREERVIAFVGNFAPLTFSAGVPLLEEQGVAAIGGDGGEAAWFRSPMAFPINGQTISRSRPIAKWALANLDVRKVAVLYVSEAAAPGVLARNFSDEWRRNGGEVVLEAGVSLVQPDYTSEIIRARNAGAEVLYLVLEQAACNRLFDAARRQQFRPIFLTTACPVETLRNARDLTTDRSYSAHSARLIKGATPAEQEVLEAVARFDPRLAPDGAFMFAWLGGKLFEEAMAQPGAELTAAGVVEALHRLPATTLDGLTPQQAWPPGPTPEGTCGMVSVFNGEESVLLTEDFVC